MTLNREYADQIHRHVIIVGNNETMKERFRRVTCPLHTFTDVDSAVAFIREQERAGMAVFSIVSGELAHPILPVVYPLRHIVCFDFFL